MPFISECLPVAKCARQDERLKFHSDLLHAHENITQKGKYYKLHIPSNKDDYSASFRSLPSHSAYVEACPNEAAGRKAVAVTWYASQVRFLFADSE